MSSPVPASQPTPTNQESRNARQAAQDRANQAAYQTFVESTAKGGDTKSIQALSQGGTPVVTIQEGPYTRTYVGEKDVRSGLDKYVSSFYTPQQDNPLRQQTSEYRIVEDKSPYLVRQGDSYGVNPRFLSPDQQQAQFQQQQQSQQRTTQDILEGKPPSKDYAQIFYMSPEQRDLLEKSYQEDLAKYKSDTKQYREKQKEFVGVAQGQGFSLLRITDKSGKTKDVPLNYREMIKAGTDSTFKVSPLDPLFVTSRKNMIDFRKEQKEFVGASQKQGFTKLRVTDETGKKKDVPLNYRELIKAGSSNVKVSPLDPLLIESREKMKDYRENLKDYVKTAKEQGYTQLELKSDKGSKIIPLSYRDIIKSEEKGKNKFEIKLVESTRNIPVKDWDYLGRGIKAAESPAPSNPREIFFERLEKSPFFFFKPVAQAGAYVSDVLLPKSNAIDRSSRLLVSEVGGMGQFLMDIPNLVQNKPSERYYPKVLSAPTTYVSGVTEGGYKAITEKNFKYFVGGTGKAWQTAVETAQRQGKAMTLTGIALWVAPGTQEIKAVKALSPIKSLSLPVAELGQKVFLYRGLELGYGTRTIPLIGRYGTGEFYRGSPNIEKALLSLEKPSLIGPSGRSSFEVLPIVDYTPLQIKRLEPILKNLEEKGVLKKGRTEQVIEEAQTKIKIKESPEIKQQLSQEYKKTRPAEDLSDFSEGIKSLETQQAIAQGQSRTRNLLELVKGSDVFGRLKNFPFKVNRGDIDITAATEEKGIKAADLIISVGVKSKSEIEQLKSSIKTDIKQSKQQLKSHKKSSPEASQIRAHISKQQFRLSKLEKLPKNFGIGRVGTNVAYGEVFPIISGEYSIGSGKLLSGISKETGQKVLQQGIRIEDTPRNLYFSSPSKKLASEYASKKDEGIILEHEWDMSKIFRFPDLPEKERGYFLALDVKNKIQRFYISQERIMSHVQSLDEGWLGATRPYEPGRKTYEVFAWDNRAIKSSREVKPSGYMIKNPKKFINIVTPKDELKNITGIKADRFLGSKYPKDKFTQTIEGTKSKIKEQGLLQQAFDLGRSTSGIISREALKQGGLSEKDLNTILGNADVTIGPLGHRYGKDIFRDYLASWKLAQTAFKAGRKDLALQIGQQMGKRVKGESFIDWRTELRSAITEGIPQNAKINLPEQPSIWSASRVGSAGVSGFMFGASAVKSGASIQSPKKTSSFSTRTKSTGISSTSILSTKSSKSSTSKSSLSASSVKSPNSSSAFSGSKSSFSPFSGSSFSPKSSASPKSPLSIGPSSSVFSPNVSSPSPPKSPLSITSPPSPRSPLYPFSPVSPRSLFPPSPPMYYPINPPDIKQPKIPKIMKFGKQGTRWFGRTGYTDIVKYGVKNPLAPSLSLKADFSALGGKKPKEGFYRAKYPTKQPNMFQNTGKLPEIPSILY